MVWVHTCVFPFYSELCGVRGGTHSAIRCIHTLFTPIDVQHAATEGHLKRREREGGTRERKQEKGSVNREAFKHISSSLAHNHTCHSYFSRSHNTNWFFLAWGVVKGALRVVGIDKHDKSQMERSEPLREWCQPPGPWLCHSQQGATDSHIPPHQGRVNPLLC